MPALQGGAYCIDSTEVTNAEYAKFVAAKGADASGQTPECSWNTTYIPSAGWPATGKDGYPVVYVDWCDAFAYCKWAGKHLCGKVGGGSNLEADYADATKSEWFNACSKGGTLAYPYGNTYSGSACNGTDNGVSAGVPVGSKATCEGGYPGLFDLSGNLWEWEDSCSSRLSAGNAGAMDLCHARGGSFRSKDSLLRFDESDVSYRNYTDGTLGLRCCAASP